MIKTHQNIKFRNWVLFLIVLLGSISCINNNTFYEDYHKFEDLSWNRFEILKFEVTVEDIQPEYDVYLNLRHIPEIPYKEFDINMTVFTPSGGMRTSDYNLERFDRDGKNLSQCLGDLCDLKVRIRRNLTFTEAGLVTFEIENKFTKVEMPGIIEVGLILERSEGN